jgi:hypothetical protein
MRILERADRVASVAALLVLVGSVGVNVLQARRINELINPEPVKRLVGKRLTALQGLALGGTPTTIARP